ncbi:MAG: UDP-glucose 4-epimerase GalE [Burkholderiales bacterium]
MTVLVTGGCGYIGSHVAVRLLAAGHDVLIVDDLSNTRASVVARIARICGRAPRFREADVTRRRALAAALAGERIASVVHLAGRKAVGESVADPLLYHRVNFVGTLNVREATGDCPFVYSSSATVYGNPAQCPVTETAPAAPANPYGSSKLASEVALREWSAAHPAATVVILRYFNPVGAHPSGLIGDDPAGVPQNLMPRIERVAVGADPVLPIHGDDYPTRDGTAVRDYVHVEDLAEAHVRALALQVPGATTLNLGSAQGATVREVLQAFERATGRRIPVRVGPRRPGDVPTVWADASRAREALGWTARRSLETACRDAMRWRRWWSAHVATEDKSLAGAAA